jgi:hypothetical protein
VAREVHQRTPPLARLSRCLAMVVITAAIYAGGVALQPRQEALDVRPEIDRVIAIEKQTAALYDHAVERFKKGRIPAAALAELIEDTIEPRLRLVAKRLRSLQDVPRKISPASLPPPSSWHCATKAGASAPRRCNDPTWPDCARLTPKSRCHSPPWIGSVSPQSVVTTMAAH